ncbi:hypothetical protein [Tolypothrix sp. VBCCA 56010]|uniref:hypothetical protein n=1 Tax=Tolypothrix sp. VBCCA 56010 TaxID=3137731 RepID=UPI003D7C6085
MERSKLVAIITGAISIILAIAYLILVQLLDFRGEMKPAPISQLTLFPLQDYLSSFSSSFVSFSFGDGKAERVFVSPAPVLDATCFMPGDPSTAVAPLSVTMGDWRTRSRSVSLWEKGGSLNRYSTLHRTPSGERAGRE